ncbi:uncharacterized protein LOC133187901 [Saccostrea echinata]|uniref:uncharacterized protein LOC133187901 n=1 Tax=Saccostrea echinata TaxID=191078 RepID=UPI002A8284C0|nr:uncharacterized protein LOC133187901 [Saccostrea echinata]
MCREIQSYDRTLENEMIVFFERIQTSFTETLTNLKEYSDRRNISHVITGSCRKNDYLKKYMRGYKQNDSSYHLTIEENRDKNLKTCIYDKNTTSTFNDIIGICLKRLPLSKIKPAAAKILGITPDTKGYRFDCNLMIRNLQPTLTTVTDFTVTMEVKRTQYLQKTMPDGGWFLCGTAVGIITSSAIFCAVWKHSTYKNRKIEKHRKNTTEEAIASVYHDIDEYELMPIYRDTVKRERFIKPRDILPRTCTMHTNKSQSVTKDGDSNMDANKDIDEEYESREMKHTEQSNGIVDFDCYRQDDHGLTIKLEENRESDPYFVLAKRKSSIKNPEEFKDQDPEPDSETVDVKVHFSDSYGGPTDTREQGEGIITENKTSLSDDCDDKHDDDTYFVIDSTPCPACPDI